MVLLLDHSSFYGRVIVRRCQKNAFTLSDVREPTLTIVFQPCGRRGRYAIARLIKEYGDVRLPIWYRRWSNVQKRSPSASMIVARHAARG
jgi:hypothetical protein